MRDLMTIILLTVVFTVLPASSASASWLIYSKPEFRGRIIDAQTKHPIQGVVVVAMYKTHTIIGGPGGGDFSIIHVKEALTDANGEFRIPAYNTLIQPNSYEDVTNFIIYKPGYASHPHRWGPRIHPFDYCGPEILFSKEIGTKGDIRHKSQVITITYGVAELPKLQTNEERIRAVPSRVFGLASIDVWKSTPLLNEEIEKEHKRLGLE